MAILLQTLSQLAPKLLMAILVARRLPLTTLTIPSAARGLPRTTPPTMTLGLLTIVLTMLQPRARTSTQPLPHPMGTPQPHQRGPHRHQNSLDTGLMHRHPEGHQRHIVDNRKRLLGAVTMGQGTRMVRQVLDYGGQERHSVGDGRLGRRASGGLVL